MFKWSCNVVWFGWTFSRSGQVPYTPSIQVWTGHTTCLHNVAHFLWITEQHSTSLIQTAPTTLKPPYGMFYHHPSLSVEVIIMSLLFSPWVGEQDFCRYVLSHKQSCYMVTSYRNLKCFLSQDEKPAFVHNIILEFVLFFHNHLQNEWVTGRAVRSSCHNNNKTHFHK